MSSISFETHNHKACLQEALKTAESLCLDQGERFTALRRTVLEFVWNSHEPVKAYDLLDKLKTVHPGSAPPTVYRALDFLQANGLVHKIESLNAYLGCGDPTITHSGQFLICSKCGSVAELDDHKSNKDLENSASTIGFKVEKMTVEMHGVCQQCNQ